MKIIEITEGASGYIPSKRQAKDPRFSTALTIDIKPDSIRKAAAALKLGSVQRNGVPPTAKTNGKV